MKAKAMRQKLGCDRESASSATATATTTVTATGTGVVRKRPGEPLTATSPSKMPMNQRDARNGDKDRPLEAIRPVRNFANYVDYDLSKMTDTNAGFLTAEDDPHNKAMHKNSRSDRADQKPANMTQKEWEKRLLLKSMEQNRTNPFEYGPEFMKSKEQRRCRECNTTDIDWKWADTFGVSVCNACKDKDPDKYSLLTKTEAKEDYLLTDPELRDEELLPHLEKANPHSSTWNNMMLFLRCQVEEYAFSEKKWGSPEALDREFERREAAKKRQRETRFKSRLLDLKKKTRVEAWRRAQRSESGGAFGDVLGKAGKHVHTFGRPVMNAETGMGVKTCVECGMEIEELEI